MASHPLFCAEIPATFNMWEQTLLRTLNVASFALLSLSQVTPLPTSSLLLQKEKFMMRFRVYSVKHLSCSGQEFSCLVPKPEVQKPYSWAQQKVWSHLNSSSTNSPEEHRLHPHAWAPHLNATKFQKIVTVSPLPCFLDRVINDIFKNQTLVFQHSRGHQCFIEE